jgi:cytochrome b
LEALYEPYAAVSNYHCRVPDGAPVFANGAVPVAVTWDGWTRLTHWLLVLAVLLSWISYEEDYLQVHQYSGYLVLVLVVTRLVWGFVGSVHSRFSDFIVSPPAAVRYLLGRHKIESGAGHNPAGGWSVLVLLLLLLLQAVTGLFNSDELMFDGPFYHALDRSWTDRLGAMHEWVFWVLSGFIGLHIVAVLFYQWGRGKDLIGPMLHGGSQGERSPRPFWLALLIALLLGAALYIAIQYAPKPEVFW